MNHENAEKIGNYIGRHIKNEETTQLIRLGKFIRISVNVNITQRLKIGCFITRENGDKLWIAFKYETLADFCYECGKADLIAQACLAPIQKELREAPDQQRWGPWLRTTRLMVPRTPGEDQIKTTNAPKQPLEYWAGKGETDMPSQDSMGQLTSPAPRFEPPASKLISIHDHRNVSIRLPLQDISNLTSSRQTPPKFHTNLWGP